MKYVNFTSFGLRTCQIREPAAAEVERRPHSCKRVGSTWDQLPQNRDKGVKNPDLLKALLVI